MVVHLGQQEKALERVADEYLTNGAELVRRLAGVHANDLSTLTTEVNRVKASRFLVINEAASEAQAVIRGEGLPGFRKDEVLSQLAAKSEATATLVEILRAMVPSE